MAVENVDIGSIITGAIDRFYEQLDRERQWFAAQERKVKGFLESLTEGFNTYLRSGRLLEANDDLDFDDDEGYDPAAREALKAWRANLYRSVAGDIGGEEGSEKKPEAPRQKRSPAARRPRKTPDYRRGYQAGWKAAHTGHPAQPDQNQGDDYVRGYMDGHRVSGHAQNVIKHFEKSIEADNAAQEAEKSKDKDLAAQHYSQADAHAEEAQKHAMEMIRHHYNDWVAGAATKQGLSPKDAEEAINSVMGKMILPTQKRARWDRKLQQTVRLPGRRAPIVGAIHHVASLINDNIDNPDEAHPYHPETFSKHVGRMAAYFAGREKVGEMARGAKGHGGEAADGGDDNKKKKGGRGVTPERADAGPKPEDAAAGEEKLRAAKEQLAMQAWSPEEYQKHVETHGNHPLAHHSDLESAKSAALNHWKSRMLYHVHNAMGPGRKLEPTPVKTGEVGPDGNHITTDFDIGKALISIINHPEGAFSRNARAAAIREQIPGYTGRNHPAHPAAAKLQRAESWLASLHPHFDRNGPMAQISAGRTMAYGKGRHAGVRGRQDPQQQQQQQSDEVVEQLLNYFEAWLRENVNSDDDGIAAIMEELEAGAYELVRPLTTEA